MHHCTFLQRHSKVAISCEIVGLVERESWQTPNILILKRKYSIWSYVWKMAHMRRLLFIVSFLLVFNSLMYVFIYCYSEYITRKLDSIKNQSENRVKRESQYPLPGEEFYPYKWDLQNIWAHIVKIYKIIFFCRYDFGNFWNIIQR